MIDVSGWSWVVDTDEMTCRNAENEVTIKIEKEGKILRGIIQDMPIALFSKIAGYRDGERIIEKIVKTAEAEYLKEEYLKDECLKTDNKE